MHYSLLTVGQSPEAKRALDTDLLDRCGLEIDPHDEITVKIMNVGIRNCVCQITSLASGHPSF